MLNSLHASNDSSTFGRLLKFMLFLGLGLFRQICLTFFLPIFDVLLLLFFAFFPLSFRFLLLDDPLMD